MALTRLDRAALFVFAMAAPALAAPALAADPSLSEARADYQRGLAADLGTNGRPDPVLAYHYYQLAAKMGDTDAELNLGVMNDSGVGTLADATQAALWYARAASHGNSRAAFDLGQLYEAGDGVPQNRPMAAAWFARAAQEGIVAASYRAERLDTTAGPALPMAAPSLAAPAAGTVLGQENIELVWVPGSSEPDTHYWVQVRSTENNQTMVYRPTEVSAMLVRLPAGNADYSWRVFAAAPGHYQASGWSAFSVRGGDVCCLALLTTR